MAIRRRSNVWRAFVLSAAILSVCYGVVLGEAPMNRLSGEDRALLDDFATKYAALMERYHSVRMSGIVEQTFGSEKQPEAKRTYEITFAARGASNQRLEKVYAPSQADSRPGVKAVSREVTILNDEGYLTAASVGPSDDMQLRVLDDDRMMGRAVLMSESPPSSMFAIAGAPINHFLMQDPAGLTEYEIVSVRSWVNGAGREVLTIRAQAKGPSGHDVAIAWTVDKNSWAMLAYELGNARLSDPGAEVWKAELSYDFDGDVPVLRSVSNWTEVGPSRMRVNTQKCQILELKFEPPPIEEFSPASIGIDVQFPEPASKRFVYVLLLVGALLLGVYIASRFWTSRASS